MQSFNSSFTGKYQAQCNGYNFRSDDLEAIRSWCKELFSEGRIRIGDSVSIYFPTVDEHGFSVSDVKQLTFTNA